MQKCVPGGEGQGISPTRNGVPTRKAVRKCLLGRKRINYHNSLAILKLPVMSSILCLLLTRIILDPEYALLFKFFFFFLQQERDLIVSQDLSVGSPSGAGSAVKLVP